MLLNRSSFHCRLPALRGFREKFREDLSSVGKLRVLKGVLISIENFREKPYKTLSFKLTPQLENFKTLHLLTHNHDGTCVSNCYGGFLSTVLAVQ